MKRAQITDVWVDVPEDFPFLIEALCRADGGVMSIDMEPCECRDVLISAGYALENEQGGIYGTRKLRDDKERILNAFRGQLN